MEGPDHPLILIFAWHVPKGGLAKVMAIEASTLRGLVRGSEVVALDRDAPEEYRRYLLESGVRLSPTSHFGKSGPKESEQGRFGPGSSLEPLLLGRILFATLKEKVGRVRVGDRQGAAGDWDYLKHVESGGINVAQEPNTLEIPAGTVSGQ